MESACGTFLACVLGNDCADNCFFQPQHSGFGISLYFSTQAANLTNTVGRMFNQGMQCLNVLPGTVEALTSLASVGQNRTMPCNFKSNIHITIHHSVMILDII